MKQAKNYIKEAKEALGLSLNQNLTYAILEKKGNDWIIIQTFTSEKTAIRTFNNHDYDLNKFKVASITWKDIYKSNKAKKSN